MAEPDNTVLEPLVYTINETAERWKCSRGKVYTMINSGEVETVKIGHHIRIPAREVKRKAGA
jgi:excisionase family DNA binding protein